MKTKLRLFLQPCLVLTGVFYFDGCASPELKGYQGTPFHDSVYHGGPQKIPGRVMCAYYDLGGEGVAYHDADAKNNGSGGFEPGGGGYFKNFPLETGGGTSFTKIFPRLAKKTPTIPQPPSNLPSICLVWAAR